MAVLSIFLVVMVCGCAASTTSPDPISGSWTVGVSNNGSTATGTLVFGQDGNFNGYYAGVLTLSGHWTKVNDTAYNVVYGNKTQVFIMSGDKSHISESSSPDVMFTKQ